MFGAMDISHSTSLTGERQPLIGRRGSDDGGEGGNLRSTLAQPAGYKAGRGIAENNARTPNGA